MLRLVVGFKSHGREDEPEVLYLGHSGSRVHEVIGANIGKVGEEFVSLGVAEIPVMRRARVSPSVKAMENRSGSAALDNANESSDGLDDMTIDDLKEYDTDVDLTGCNVKQDYVDRHRAYNVLDESTVPALKDLAQSEQVELPASARKSDIINAVLAGRRSK